MQLFDQSQGSVWILANSLNIPTRDDQDQV